MKRCPRCGATSSSGDRFCESDGATLVDEAPVAPAAAPCELCGEGTLESDGFCSSCGRRAPGRPALATLGEGASLAGGVVTASRAGDEYLVALPGGQRALVVLGEASVVGREADALGRVGSGAFPEVVSRGVDGTHGAFVALAPPPAGAAALADVGPGLTMAEVVTLLRSLLDAARSVEALALVWELHRDDVFVEPGGQVRLSRLRVPRKLHPSERLDARAVVEAAGPTFVPLPALGGPSRAFRLLLPHVAIPGDPGSSVDDVGAELDAIERETALPGDDASRIGGVCDPGLRRPHNEDALASAHGTLGEEPWTVLVVCDGVSSSSHADQASTAAARVACDALAHFARSGDIALEPAAAAVATAIRAAHVAVCAQGIDVEGGAPAGTTIVVGLLWRRRLTVGWVGDSRAYWVSEQGSELLTHDHSWANEAIARGEVTAAEAAMSPLAHALTRCLGPLEDDDADADADQAAGASRRITEVLPDVRSRDLPGPGWIVLCSDGFWNYFSRAADVAGLVHGLGPGASPAKVARGLVNQALTRGGHDNTTVLVHRHR